MTVTSNSATFPSRPASRLAAFASIAAIALLAGCTQPAPPAPAPVAYNPPAPMAAAPADINWYQVTFANNSSRIDATGQQSINHVADAMQANPALMATVVGKADATGGDAANMRLSKQRADAVRSALLHTGKVNAQRIDERWTGERPQGDRPMVNGMNVGGRVVDIALH